MELVSKHGMPQLVNGTLANQRLAMQDTPVTAAKRKTRTKHAANAATSIWKMAIKRSAAMSADAKLHHACTRVKSMHYKVANVFQSVKTQPMNSVTRKNGTHEPKSANSHVNLDMFHGKDKSPAKRGACYFNKKFDIMQS
jgi:hypothetical protein